MRLLRLRLQDFRGVSKRELTFSEDGITVVEGQNEIGKSSFAEAIDVLFTYPDTSVARAVTALQPVGRDVGPEVELEWATGPYRLLYRKRFLKSPETTLRVLAPTKVQLTGRDAHDRVQAILAETLDSVLWSALRVKQGAAMEATSFGGAPSLARALETSGGRESVDQDDDLFQRVVAERGIYFTPTGQPKMPLRNAKDALDRAEKRVAQCESDLDAMETDIERSGEIVRERAAWIERRGQRGADFDKLKLEVDALAKREEEARRIELETRNARLAAQVRLREKRARDELVEQVTAAVAQRSQLEERAQKHAPALREARTALEQAKAAHAAAQERALAADATNELRENDFRYQHAKLDLEQLGERRDRVRAARVEAAAASKTLAKNAVDNDVVRRLETLQLELNGSQARLEAGSPQVKLRAKKKLSARADGLAIELEPKHEFETTVQKKLEISIPGVLELEVAVGASVEELAAKRDQDERSYQAALKACGAADLEEAKKLRDERAEATRALAQSERQLKENLRDLTQEAMAEKIDRLRGWVVGYPAKRVSTPPLPETFDDATQRKREAREEAKAARAAQGEASTAYDNAVNAAARASTQAQEVDVQLRHVTERAVELEGKLARARLPQSDEEIVASWRAADDAARAAEERLGAIKEALAARSPERVRRLLDTAQTDVADAQRQVRALEDEQKEVGARLDLRGEQGLFDAREDARAEFARTQYEHNSIDRRASAAALLFDTMTTHRDRARASYAAPLRDAIQELGRPVFGPDFAVELDSDLAIATRTLDGSTLPLDQLSVGAREQLAVLARVACAMLVDAKDGVPLVFDDVLGYADPERTTAMNQVLAGVASRCQIVILTCNPTRFSHVLDGPNPARYLRLFADGRVETILSSALAKPAPQETAETANRLESRPQTPIAQKPMTQEPITQKPITQKPVAKGRRRTKRKPAQDDADFPLFRRAGIDVSIDANGGAKS